MALNFPAKIYQILENEDTDIIRWHRSGTAFRILDAQRFEREIIPKYFRHNQLSSVQRQLNLYGFKCVNRGEDKGAFYHGKFRRGDWETVKSITRYIPQKKIVTDPTNASRTLNEDSMESFPKPSVVMDRSLLLPHDVAAQGALKIAPQPHKTSWMHGQIPSSVNVSSAAMSQAHPQLHGRISQPVQRPTWSWPPEHAKQQHMNYQQQQSIAHHQPQPLTQAAQQHHYNPHVHGHPSVNRSVVPAASAPVAVAVSTSADTHPQVHPHSNGQHAHAHGQTHGHGHSTHAQPQRSTDFYGMQVQLDGQRIGIPVDEFPNKTEPNYKRLINNRPHGTSNSHSHSHSHSHSGAISSTHNSKTGIAGPAAQLKTFPSANASSTAAGAESGAGAGSAVNFNPNADLFEDFFLCDGMNDEEFDLFYGNEPLGSYSAGFTNVLMNDFEQGATTAFPGPSATAGGGNVQGSHSLSRNGSSASLNAAASTSTSNPAGLHDAGMSMAPVALSAEVVAKKPVMVDASTNTTLSQATDREILSRICSGL